MEQIEQKTLPFKKRPYAVALQFQDQETPLKTTSFTTDMLPLKRERSQNDQLQEPFNQDRFFNPPPNKRFRSEKTNRFGVSSDDHLNALFNFVFGSETTNELGIRVEVEAPKKREIKKKKGLGLGLGWKSGWKKLRREKLSMSFGAGKEKVKALFGQFWAGNDEIDSRCDWEIEHFTDPLALPFVFRSSS